MSAGTVRRRGALVAVLALVALVVPASRAQVAVSDPTGYAVDCLAVGAAVNAPDRTDGGRLPLFHEADDAIGPLTIRRSFDPSLPRTFDTSAAAGDRDADVRSFVSRTPPGA